MTKSKTKAEQQWLSDVAELGCICCRNMGYGASRAELHHVRNGQGMGQRADHYSVLPLCPQHHRHATKRDSMQPQQHGSSSTAANVNCWSR